MCERERKRKKEWKKKTLKIEKEGEKTFWRLGEGEGGLSSEDEEGLFAVLLLLEAGKDPPPLLRLVETIFF